MYEHLKQVLTVADLVKFAKHKPFINENDLSLNNAYLFIDQTKEEEPLPEELLKESKEVTDKELPSEEESE